MNEEIYAATVIPACESVDGEYPTRVILTQEANGFAVWHDSHDGGIVLREYIRADRNRAIEAAVHAADEELRMRAEIKRRKGIA